MNVMSGVLKAGEIRALVAWARAHRTTLDARRAQIGSESEIQRRHLAFAAWLAQTGRISG